VRKVRELLDASGKTKRADYVEGTERPIVAAPDVKSSR